MVQTSHKVTEGELDFDIPSAVKTCKTWYRIVGDLSAGICPLVVLHGGPGYPTDYLFVMADLTAQFNIPIILYDQIGCGRSTHLEEKMGDATFWTVELFEAELENLLQKLSIGGEYDLYGQSWGGMLAAGFAAKRPTGLRRLILSDSPASMALWVEACDGLREGLPGDVQEVLRRHEKHGTTGDEEYKKAVQVFMDKHVCRLDPMPEDVANSDKAMEEDGTVYQTMWGPSEIFVTGTLKHWSTIDILPQIEAPTLLINGRFDEAQNVCVYPFFEKISRVRWITMDQSSHTPMHEERERYMEVVGQFLTE